MPSLQNVEAFEPVTTGTQIYGQDDPKISLSPPTDVRTPTGPENQSMSKGKDLIRLYKLQFLALFKSWRSPLEQRKVALHQSHLVAAGHALLHLVPLCGAITLLVLNLSHYFVGPFFAFSTTLQFVAKLHELLMQASMAEIVLCIIRMQALEEYVPLGALSAATQAMHISYIWSIDFLAAVTSKSFSGPRRYLFIVLVPLLIVLTALVGPSSATLMIPRPGSSTLSGLLPWGMTSMVDSMFPSHLDAKQNLTFNFESFEATYNLEYSTKYSLENGIPCTIIQAYSNKEDVPRASFIPRALQYMELSDPHNDWNTTTATIPTQLSTQVLNMVSVDIASNETVSIELPRPVVAARCTSLSKMKASSPITYFLDSGDSIGTTFSFKDLIHQYLNRFNSTDTLVDPLPPLWSASPEPGSSSYIVNFFPDICSSSRGSKPHPISDFLDDGNWTTNSCLYTQTCTVAAYWELSEHKLIGSDGLRQVRTAPLSKAGFRIPRNTRPITVDWNSISRLNSARFANMILSSTNSKSSLGLAVSLATVISETSWQLDWVIPSLDREANQPTQYVITKASHGYGYGTSSTSRRLSLAVIMAYCIVTVAYITYMLASGHTSTAWNSATELIVLALQSRHTEHLSYTSVGISSMQTYREAIGIRVGDSKSLEIVLAKDPNAEVRNMKRVLPNRAY